MRTKFWNAAVLVLILNSGIWNTSHAEQPLDVLQGHIDTAFSILNDPQLAEHGKKAIQLNKLRDLLDQAFDFEDFSRRVLADHWHKFKPLQQRQFVDIFSEFLSKFYMRELQERYTNETVVLIGQRLSQEFRAIVLAEVFWNNIGIPVEVRMSKRSGTWKIYDLSALGISAVLNYRAQLNEILQQESPSQVIARLKEKVRHIDQQASAYGYHRFDRPA